MGSRKSFIYKVSLSFPARVMGSLKLFIYLHDEPFTSDTNDEAVIEFLSKLGKTMPLAILSVQDYTNPARSVELHKKLPNQTGYAN